MSDLPNPDTREEVFLRVLADGEGDLPDPVTREERYLYAAATGSEDYPTDPHTRKEIYLAAIAAGGSSASAKFAQVNYSETSSFTVRRINV